MRYCRPALSTVRSLLAPLAATVVLFGCAWGTDVEETADPGTYRVSQTYAPARGGVPKAKSVAVKMARNKCAELGREFYPLKETIASWPPSYEVEFSCIDIDQGG